MPEITVLTSKGMFNALTHGTSIVFYYLLRLDFKPYFIHQWPALQK